MPRKPIQRSNEHYYHLTARSNNKETFFLPIDVVWNIMLYQLGLLQKEYKLKIVALVLMNNHFHLLMMTPEEDIDRIMYFFMKNMTLKIQKASGRINKVFGGRYKGCLIDNHAYLLNAYKYIYRNPVAAGVCELVEDYPFSSLYFQRWKISAPVQFEEIMTSYNTCEYSWLNLGYASDEAGSIKNALRKSVFSYSRDRATGKTIAPLVN